MKKLFRWLTNQDYKDAKAEKQEARAELERAKALLEVIKKQKAEDK